MKKRIWFIINPISGVGKKNTIPKLIHQHLNHLLFDYEIIYTQYAKHATIIAQQAVDINVDIVCAVGGDGSVHDVCAALIHTYTTLAILPTGSGNGLARHLKISTNLVKAIQLINRHSVLEIDVLKANDVIFVNAGGYGFDAVVSKTFSQQKNRGLKTYIKASLKEFFKFKPIEVRIQIDNEEQIIRKAFLFSIANASQYGNNFKISPHSSLTDGKAEISLLPKVNLAKGIQALKQFFTGEIHKNPQYEIFTFTHCKIQLPHNIAHYDGEVYEVDNTIEVEVLPKALKVLVGLR